MKKANDYATTLADLARELNATTHEVYNFANLTDPYKNTLIIDAEEADAIREAWHDANDYII